MAEERQKIADAVREIPWPAVFGDWDGLPSSLQAAAMSAAAWRERCSEVVGRVRSVRRTAEDEVASVTEAYHQAMDASRVEVAQRAPSQWSWEERSAQARLRVVDRATEVNRYRLLTSEMDRIIEEAEEKYRAWRDTEFALDRQIRLFQFRHGLGEL